MSIFYTCVSILLTTDEFGYLFMFFIYSSLRCLVCGLFLKEMI